MKAKTTSPAQPMMSYGPTIEDLRTAIVRAEDEGVVRGDMLLRLTFRDASLIKRSPAVSVDEVSFANGEMRFLGVRIVAGPVALSRLEAPALPDPEPAPEPVKAPKAKAASKTKASAKAAVAAVDAGAGGS